MNFALDYIFFNKRFYYFNKQKFKKFASGVITSINLNKSLINTYFKLYKREE